MLIIEASPIKATNFKRAGEKQPIYVEGLRVHLLARGASYQVNERKFIAG
ncbi:hypothetical protein LWM68_27220 [Niabella sp. W65]|nr:hypothetical protein [Niabella sp. W65]MCH7366135.1 hypothetical protein [Niabella sp. W65]ULT41866.1 hypothetical protein KRR40_46150 [Niabella sp. I65]